MYISAVLEEHGYEVASAGDGKEGLERLKEFVPDLLILDVMMPRKTGFTLFKQIQKEEHLKDMPVLMLTGVAGVLEELDAESEVDDDKRPLDSLREALRKNIRQMRDDGLVRPEMFMDKPVDPDQFIERVEELIGK